MSRKETILNLRQVLVKCRESLRKVLTGDINSLKAFRTQAFDDPPDIDSVNGEISSQLAEVESCELVRVEHALERMRDGLFGICEVCEVSIPMARLMALPYATRCIKCQREAECRIPPQEKGGDWPESVDPFDDDNLDLSLVLSDEVEMPDWRL